MRVSGFVTEPWSAFVECQLGGSATVTPAVPTRLGASALAGRASAGAISKAMTRRMYKIFLISTLQLAELVREKQPCVVLTGAGISTESGIPDFRGTRAIIGRAAARAAVRALRLRAEAGHRHVR
jgi:hypothetical protein